jgi:hypothetical protein
MAYNSHAIILYEKNKMATVLCVCYRLEAYLCKADGSPLCVLGRNGSVLTIKKALDIALHYPL